MITRKPSTTRAIFAQHPSSGDIRSMNIADEGLHVMLAQ